MTAFFSDVAWWVRKGRSIHIDLRAIRAMGPEAIVALLSLAQKADDVRFGGNMPNDQTLAGMLADSGFFRFMKSVVPTPSKSAPLFHQSTAYKVEPDTALALVRFVTENILGKHQPAPGAYESLLEAMANTHEHALGNPNDAQDSLPWWAAANYDSKTSTGVFTFVDSGVGIIRSLRRKRFFAAIKQALGIENNADFLREVLAGEVESRTGLPYRGKGLPKIRKAVERGRLRGLVIVTNDVWANVGTGEFRVLKVPFDGTLLRWEITRSELEGGRAS